MASEPTTEPTDERTADAPTEPLTPAEPSEPSGGDTPSAEAPVAKKATRKRATTSRAKKAAPPNETASDSAAPAEPDAGAVQDGVEAAPAPTKRARTRRAKAPEAAPVVEAPAEEVSPEAPEEAPTEDAVPEESVVGDGAPEASSDARESTQGGTDENAREDTDADDDLESAAAAPSFGLLFKAPEPVAPRRRRATAAAGAPAPASSEPTDSDRGDAGGTRRGEQQKRDSRRRGDAHSDEARGDEARGDEEAREDPKSTDEDRTAEQPTGSDDAESGAGRRSRRRGGRGRRPRSGDGDQDGQDGSTDGAPSEQSGADQESKPARRGRRGSTSDSGAARAAGPDAGAGEGAESDVDDDGTGDDGGSSRRRRRRRRGGADGESDESQGARARDEVTSLKGSTRLEAKKQRRREGREAGRRRTIITEAEFLARRESVERIMVVRERDSKTQIAVLEDGVLVEHYVSRETGASMIGNVYLGRVQNVLPSMEAAFVDIGKGRNAVLYAGEVNWDAAGLEGNVPKRIENALGSGDTVLVQVTKDPIGHKGARLTSQVSLPGRFLVYVPEASMTGISRKLPDTERARLKSILKKIVPDDAGVIVRTASEGASEEELTADIARLTKAWEKIQSKAETAGKKKGSASAPVLLHGEPDLTVKVIRDVFNEDFTSLVVSGERAWSDVSEYLEDVAPELAKRLSKWTSEGDLFTQYRVDEQIAKALDRKVWLPSGGSLVIDRTEAMTVVDVNTGKFVGSGGNLEETVTKNNIEAAEEIVRQLRLRDIGGIIVIDFIDMVLESNRDLVVRRLLECLGRDRTKHQVAEVTSLGLVQMTRKRVGSGLLEVFSEPCVHCSGRGVIVHTDPLDDSAPEDTGSRGRGRGRGTGNGNGGGGNQFAGSRGGGRGNGNGEDERPQPTGPTAAQIAAAAHAAALKANASANGVDVETPLAEDDGVTEDGTTTVAEGVEESAAVADEFVTDESSADERPDAEPSKDESRADAAEPGEREAPSDSTGEAHTPDIEPESEPAVRPRRKRGRVVAPAGPPGQSEVRVITIEEG